MLQSLLWTVAVVSMPLLAQHYTVEYALPESPFIPLATYLQQIDNSGLRIVSIPAGTPVPVTVEISGKVFDGSTSPILLLTLKAPIEIMMKDGQMTGDSRVPGGKWLITRESHWWTIPWLRATFVKGTGPALHTAVVVNFKHH